VLWKVSRSAPFGIKVSFGMMEGMLILVLLFEDLDFVF